MLQAREYQSRYIETAAAAMLSSQITLWSFLQEIRRQVAAGDCEAVCVCIATMNDEATIPLRLRTGSSRGPNDEVARSELGRAEKQLVKVLQSAMHIAVVMQHTASGRVATFKCPIPCSLQSIDRHTSEVLLDCYRETVRHPGLDAEFLRLFPTRVFAHTCDRHGANDKMVNALRQEEQRLPHADSVLRLALSCDIHRAATCLTRSCDLVSFHVSGMIAVAIAQRGASRLQDFRAVIGAILVRKLVIVRGGVRGQLAQGEAHDFRSALLDMLLGRRADPRPNRDGQEFATSAEQCRRITIDYYLNGDLRSEVVHHYADGHLSDEQIRAAMRTEVPLALVPRHLQVFPRHRWVGSDRVSCDCTLLAEAHGILFDAVPLWAKGVEPDKIESGEVKLPSDPAPLALEAGYMSEDDSCDPCRDGAVVPADCDTQEGIPHQRDWAALNKRMRGDATQWVSRSDTRVSLFIMCRVLVVATQLIHRYLAQAGAEWERRNDVTAFVGGRRAFRLSVAHKGLAEAVLARDILRPYAGGPFFQTHAHPWG